MWCNSSFNRAESPLTQPGVNKVNRSQGIKATLQSHCLPWFYKLEAGQVNENCLAMQEPEDDLSLVSALIQEDDQNEKSHKLGTVPSVSRSESDKHGGKWGSSDAKEEVVGLARECNIIPSSV